MVKPLSQLKTAAAVLFVAPVALLAACSPNEPVATQPGTTPPIWTGSPDPSAEAMPENEQVTVEKKTIHAIIAGPDGAQLAAATIDFNEKVAKVTWASHVDLKTGRPVENAGARYEDGEELWMPVQVIPSEAFDGAWYRTTAYSVPEDVNYDDPGVWSNQMHIHDNGSLPDFTQ